MKLLLVALLAISLVNSQPTQKSDPLVSKNRYEFSRK